MMTTREMYVLPAYDHSTFPLPRTIAAALLAIAPLLINIGYSTYTNGRLTGYADFADVALGFLLLTLAVNTLSSLAQSSVRYKAIGLVVMAALAVTAVVHMISGFGLLVR